MNLYISDPGRQELIVVKKVRTAKASLSCKFFVIEGIQGWLLSHHIGNLAVLVRNENVTNDIKFYSISFPKKGSSINYFI